MKILTKENKRAQVNVMLLPIYKKKLNELSKKLKLSQGKSIEYMLDMCEKLKE